MLAVENKAEERPDFFQRHYTLTDLAKAWHISRTTLYFWFINDPEIITYGTGKLSKGRRRPHISIRIPESVARRVYLAHTGRQATLRGGKA